MVMTLISKAHLTGENNTVYGRMVNYIDSSLYASFLETQIITSFDILRTQYDAIQWQYIANVN